jgi:hypothetical protein
VRGLSDLAPTHACKATTRFKESIGSISEASRSSLRHSVASTRTTDPPRQNAKHRRDLRRWIGAAAHRLKLNGKGGGDNARSGARRPRPVSRSPRRVRYRLESGCSFPGLKCRPGSVGGHALPAREEFSMRHGERPPSASFAPEPRASGQRRDWSEPAITVEATDGARSGPSRAQPRPPSLSPTSMRWR